MVYSTHMSQVVRTICAIGIMVCARVCVRCMVPLCVCDIRAAAPVRRPSLIRQELDVL